VCCITGQIANETDILWIAPPAWCEYVSPGTSISIVAVLIGQQYVVGHSKPHEYITTDNVITLDKRLAVLFMENRFAIDADVRCIYLHAHKS
jgi:hypothetical protein